MTGALVCGMAGVAHAEQVFVSDKLVVSVYAEANQESEKLTTLESGDAVELIEKAEGYARIKLADGREGWIRSSYLSPQMPAVLRLKQLESERSPAPAATAPAAAMIEEIKQLKEQNGALHSEVAALKAAASQKPAEASVAAAPERNVAKAPRSDDDDITLHALKWSAGIGLAAGIIGFALGYRAIAKRIERKYGKLKIV